MRWLFIHRDFPGQYLHIVRHLAAAGHELVGIGLKPESWLASVRVITYRPPRVSAATHPLAQEFDFAVQHGAAVAEVCEQLKKSGFVPDAVIGHTGWGETFFVKAVWPSTPLLGYFEFFYRGAGSDADFDPEFPGTPDLAMRLATRNAVNLVALESADHGQTATQWQRDQYPTRYRDQISILHEGIDTDLVRPDPSARLWLAGGGALGTQDQIITFSARSLEPYRGFHMFMRALPKVLRSAPDAHVVIVGADTVSYGRAPANAAHWRQQMTEELAGSLDLTRIHFLGPLNFRHYLTVLQISSVHVYLTYPFVLSWSLLEALAAGCLVIGSRTPPVEEVLIDGHNGHLVDFFDCDALAARIVEVLREGRQDQMRRAARDTVLERYDLMRICLPAYLALLERLTGQALLSETVQR